MQDACSSKRGCLQSVFIMFCLTEGQNVEVHFSTPLEETILNGLTGHSVPADLQEAFNTYTHEFSTSLLLMFLYSFDKL